MSAYIVCPFLRSIAKLFAAWLTEVCEPLPKLGTCLKFNLLGTQYFLAGAVRTRAPRDDADIDDVITTGEWFGCSTVPTPGGLCEVLNPHNPQVESRI